MLITNNGKAAQGLLVNGRVEWLKPGEARDLDYKRALPDGVTASEGKAKPAPAPKDGPKADEAEDRFAGLSDEALRDAIEEKTGERPHHKTGRDKLLATLRSD